MKPSTARVRALLILRGAQGLTPLEALRYAGTMRLAARVAELRAMGDRITTTTVRTPEGAHVARYVREEA